MVSFSSLPSELWWFGPHETDFFPSSFFDSYRNLLRPCSRDPTLLLGRSPHHSKRNRSSPPTSPLDLSFHSRLSHLFSHLHHQEEAQARQTTLRRSFSRPSPSSSKPESGPNSFVGGHPRPRKSSESSKNSTSISRPSSSPSAPSPSSSSSDDLDDHSSSHRRTSPTHPSSSSLKHRVRIHHQQQQQQYRHRCHSSTTIDFSRFVPSTLPSHQNGLRTHRRRCDQAGRVEPSSSTREGRSRGRGLGGEGRDERSRENDERFDAGREELHGERDQS